MYRPLAAVICVAALLTSAPAAAQDAESSFSLLAEFGAAIDAEGGRFGRESDPGMLIGMRGVWQSRLPVSLVAGIAGTATPIDFDGSFSVETTHWIGYAGIEVAGTLGAASPYLIATIGGAWTRARIDDDDLSDSTVKRDDGNFTGRVGGGVRFELESDLVLGIEATYLPLTARSTRSIVTVGGMLGYRF